MKKTKKDDGEKDRLRVAEERLKQVEDLARAYDDKSWFLVPVCARNVTRAGFIKAIADSRTELIHKNWHDATSAGRELSEHGAFERVELYSRKNKSRILGVIDNGRVR